MIPCEIISVEHQNYNSSSGIKLTFICAEGKKALVVFSNDKLYSKVENLKAGDLVDMELKKEGKYTNLVSIGDPVSASSTVSLPVPLAQSQLPSNQKNSYSRTSPEERDSIQRQTAIKAAVELVAASGVKFKTVNDAYQEAIQAAEGFYDFIANIKKADEEV